MAKTLKFTQENYKKLEKLYDAAVKNGEESLIFKGNELDIKYAKYLIEYLEMKYKK